jgi:hypothetical protein
MRARPAWHQKSTLVAARPLLARPVPQEVDRIDEPRTSISIPLLGCATGKRMNVPQTGRRRLPLVLGHEGQRPPGLLERLAADDRLSTWPGALSCGDPKVGPLLNVLGLACTKKLIGWTSALSPAH